MKRIFAPNCHLKSVLEQQRLTEGRQCVFFSSQSLLGSSCLLLLILRRSSHTFSRLGDNKKNREDETEDTACLYPSYEGPFARYALRTAQSLET